MCVCVCVCVCVHVCTCACMRVCVHVTVCFMIYPHVCMMDLRLNVVYLNPHILIYTEACQGNASGACTSVVS